MSNNTTQERHIKLLQLYDLIFGENNDISATYPTNTFIVILYLYLTISRIEAPSIFKGHGNKEFHEHFPKHEKSSSKAREFVFF